MKALVSAFLLMSVLAPLSFAASDCEHTCCDKFSGRWDDDFDDCKSYKDGFETCVSDCEGAIWARQQHPDISEGGTHYSCKYPPAILAAIAACALLVSRKA
jgi:hypothetical protein